MKALEVGERVFWANDPEWGKEWAIGKVKYGGDKRLQVVVSSGYGVSDEVNVQFGNCRRILDRAPEIGDECVILDGNETKESAYRKGRVFRVGEVLDTIVREVNEECAYAHYFREIAVLEPRADGKGDAVGGDLQTDSDTTQPTENKEKSGDLQPIPETCWLRLQLPSGDIVETPRPGAEWKGCGVVPDCGDMVLDFWNQTRIDISSALHRRKVKLTPSKEMECWFHDFNNRMFCLPHKTRVLAYERFEARDIPPAAEPERYVVSFEAPLLNEVE